jgi:hypothetical protein
MSLGAWQTARKLPAGTASISFLRFVRVVGVRDEVQDRNQQDGDRLADRGRAAAAKIASVSRRSAWM